MQLFFEAMEQFGIPSRVRSDQGWENILVACFVLSTLDSIVAVCWWVVQSTKDRTSLERLTPLCYCFVLPAFLQSREVMNTEPF